MLDDNWHEKVRHKKKIENTNSGSTMLNRESRKNLTGKIECEQRPRRVERMDHEDI